MTPLVTVAIAAYGWPEALALSLPSVLSQTLADFELLVIGDGCDRGSEAVVRAFEDPRVFWSNLPANSGSQSGPNNAANALARGRFIAYLGQDDLWHPEHLASLVAAIEAENADLAYAVTLVYGPPARGERAVFGLDEPGDPRFFVPPSSLMHRADLLSHIGPWADPRASALAIDHELLTRARAAGQRFVGSGRATAFKWPSAWGIDAYKTRDVSRQAALATRLARNPIRTQEEELIGMLRAAGDGALIDARPPLDLLPGEAAELNRVRRGLAPLRPLPSRVEVRLDRPLAGDGWFGPERDAGGTFRWIGKEATLLVPIAVVGPLRLRIRLANALAPESYALRVAVADAWLDSRRQDAEDGVWREAIVPEVLARAEEGRIRLRLEAPVTLVPTELDPASSDRRELGVAVSALTIEPLDAAQETI